MPSADCILSRIDQMTFDRRSGNFYSMAGRAATRRETAFMERISAVRALAFMHQDFNTSDVEEIDFAIFEAVIGTNNLDLTGFDRVHQGRLRSRAQTGYGTLDVRLDRVLKQVATFF